MKFTRETLTAQCLWTKKLLSFRTTRAPSFRFTAGQFARLGLSIGTETVWRAYTMVSAQEDDELAFFSIVVPDGVFSQALVQLPMGASIEISQEAYGFLTLDRFVDGTDLWLLATGTGVAPYLSILHSLDVWQRYEHIILVYSVHLAAELAYPEEIASLKRRFGTQFTFIPIITGETCAGILNQRIPALLLNGRLEQQAQRQLSAEHSRIMLCGNPRMLLDTRQVLEERGLRLSRRAVPGQIAVEQFW